MERLGDRMKILASDYDGTLRVNEQVTQEVLNAIHKFRSAGNLFGIVTGRSMESIRYDIEFYNIEVDFIVGNNGGTIYSKAFQKLQTTMIDFQAGLEIMKYLEREKVISYVINDGYYRCKKDVDTSCVDTKYDDITTTRNMEEILEEKAIAQIVAATKDDTQNKRICEYMNQNFSDFVEAYRNVCCVDIVPKHISKQKGLKDALSFLKKEPLEIYTIGDSYNDISMLEANYGFAMKNAPQDVKKVCKQEVSSVAEAIQFIIK